MCVCVCEHVCIHVCVCVYMCTCMCCPYVPLYIFLFIFFNSRFHEVNKWASCVHPPVLCGHGGLHTMDWEREVISPAQEIISALVSVDCDSSISFQLGNYL